MKLAFLNCALTTVKKITINTGWCHYPYCAKAPAVLPTYAFVPSVQMSKTVKKKKGK